MTIFDYLMAVLLALFALWQCVTYVRAKKQMKLPGSAPGRIIAISLLTVLAAIAMWRRGNIEHTWPIFVLLILAVGLYMLVPTGIGQQGIFSSGRMIPYGKLHFYGIHREEKNQVLFRFSLGYKEYVIAFPNEKRENVIAYMTAAQVDDFETYNLKRKKN